MHILLRYLGTVAAIMLTVYVVPGLVVTNGYTTFFLAALVWSVISIVVKPVLGILTLPITILTLGLFSFVLNAALFYAMTLVVPGFTITSIWSAFLGAFALSVFSWFIHKII